MTINIDDTTPAATLSDTPTYDALLADGAGATDRFRALRAEVDGNMEHALTLIDVSRIRSHAYHNSVASLQRRLDESELTVSQAIDQRDAARSQLVIAQANLSAPITLDDPRLADEWERAGQIATDEGFCSEYDRMCERLGIPGRNRTWNVSVQATIDLTVAVDARSAEEAEEAVDRETIQSALAHRADWNIDVNEWETDGANLD